MRIAGRLGLAGWLAGWMMRKLAVAVNKRVARCEKAGLLPEPPPPPPRLSTPQPSNLSIARPFISRLPRCLLPSPPPPPHQYNVVCVSRPTLSVGTLSLLTDTPNNQANHHRPLLDGRQGRAKPPLSIGLAPCPERAPPRGPPTTTNYHHHSRGSVREEEPLAD